MLPSATYSKTMCVFILLFFSLYYCYPCAFFKIGENNLLISGWSSASTTQIFASLIYSQFF